MADYSLSDVAHLAQKYTEDVPTIILGTGATIPLGLPSMSQLAQHLIDNVTPEPTDTVQWDQLKTDLENTCDLEQSLHNIDISLTLRNTVIYETWRLIKEKDINLSNELIAQNVKLPLTELLVHFLRTANPQISIITTNYDRMAEYAADLANACAYTGFSGGYLQKFGKTETRALYKIDIWKVHGSLDWFRGTNDQILKHPFEFHPDDFIPLIVTPGLSKYRETHKDPFRTVFSKADNALKNTKCYLCIGYGFNDEHVQPVLIDRTKNEDIPVVVITKNLTPKAKELSQSSLRKYLFIEEDTSGAKAYSNEFPDGIIINEAVWKLEEFIKMIVT